MQGYAGGRAASQYLAQRVEAASPEQLVAMLLEGGQKFLTLGIAAMKDRDYPAKARSLNRVSDIIVELNARLNHEAGGELVTNLTRIYDWWMRQLLDGAQKDQPEILERIRAEMGDLRGAWEQLHQKKTANLQPNPGPSASLSDLLG